MNEPTATASDPEVLLGNSQWLKHLALRLMQDEHAADDAVQQTWLAFCRNRPKTDEPRAWLARTLRNFIAQWYRGESRRERREKHAAPPAPVPPADLSIERAELQRQVLGMVLALREPYKSTLLLRFFDGLSAKEVARRQDIAVGTVDSRVHRALEYLRVRLDARFGERRNWALAFLATDLVRSIPGATLLGPWTLGITAAAVIVAAVGVMFHFDGSEPSDLASTAQSSGPGQPQASPANLAGTGSGTEPQPEYPTTATAPGPAENRDANTSRPSSRNTRPRNAFAADRSDRRSSPESRFDPPPPSGNDAETQLVKAIRAYYEAWEETGIPPIPLLGEVHERANRVEAERDNQGRPLLADVPFWRGILQRASRPERPRYIPGLEKLRSVREEPKPQRDQWMQRVAGETEQVSAFLSAPRQVLTKKQPVVVWLAPLEELGSSHKAERDVAREFERSRHHDGLDSAIYLLPIPPKSAIRESDELSWCDEPMVEAVLRSLSVFVLWNLRHDVERVYLDGAPSTAAACAELLARFPGSFAGATVRGFLEATPRLAPYLESSPPRLLHPAWPNELPTMERFFDERNVTQHWPDFLKRIRRDPIPEQVTYRGGPVAVANVSWVEAVIREGDAADRPGVHVQASFDEHQTIHLQTAPNVRDVILFLNDEMVDLDRSVEVLHRTMQYDPEQRTYVDPGYGERSIHRGQRSRQLQFMLDWNFTQRSGNFAEPFTAAIQLEL